MPPVARKAGDSPAELLKRHCLGTKPRWVGYLSTTGVYGDHQGRAVSEEDPLLAADEKGQARISAEQAWLDLHASHRLPVHIFRLAGIYGPGRSALDAVRQLAEGAAPPSPSQRRRLQAPYTARVHVSDICAALVASMTAPSPGAIYNVVDDDPAGRLEVMRFACQLLGMSPEVMPEPLPADSNSEVPSKQVSNAKLKQQLGMALSHPTYREGLPAILRQEQAEP